MHSENGTIFGTELNSTCPQATVLSAPCSKRPLAPYEILRLGS